MSYFDKNILRKKLINIKNQLSRKDVSVYSEIICSKLNNLDIFIKSKNIAIYHSIGSEVNLRFLFEHLSPADKKFYLPVVQQDWSLKFYPYQYKDQLTKNPWGIEEPTLKIHPIELQKLEIIVVPMLGFSKAGVRLGMGKGCYDRTLLYSHRAILIGVAFSQLEVEHLPQESHDVLMDYIITEKNLYDISRK